jgi:hypothetical protein
MHNNIDTYCLNVATIDIFRQQLPKIYSHELLELIHPAHTFDRYTDNLPAGVRGAKREEPSFRQKAVGLQPMPDSLHH